MTFASVQPAPAARTVLTNAYRSASFEASRREYHDGRRAVSERGAWVDWLEYFCNGVAGMSEDALGRAERINELLIR